MNASPDAARIAELEQQERDLVFDRFDNATAYLLGSRLARLAFERGLKVGIDIQRPGLTLFRTMLPGVTADQEVWIQRKAALVLRMEASGALVEARFGGFDPSSIGWLDHRYAITSGAFPIRVTGVGVVAVATASGLSSEEDHDLIVEGLRAQIAEERS
ncbi:heme-binding protein [Rathayibacter sp. VKM Ac-2927]|uniref:heme-binding protein n=1 Tax=Rathayibacter sp. VKM Ac-2927 TaxID=2929478 RepID=UPI001FB4E431|nr:heme-binding protein [Rathayibacter sp. VKM Ac-2927]MCJ1688364.1 heme-binding protein [Rathayibacter sp. VKM Ac-2927]